MRYPEHFRVRWGLGQAPQQARRARSAGGSFGRIRWFVGTQALLAPLLTSLLIPRYKRKDFLNGEN